MRLSCHLTVLFFLLNAFIWAIGNSFAGSTLLIYFITSLGVSNSGLAIAAIKASPQITGILRMTASTMVAWFTRKCRFQPTPTLSEPCSPSEPCPYSRTPRSRPHAPLHGLDTGTKWFVITTHLLSVIILAIFPWFAMVAVRWSRHEPDVTHSMGLLSSELWLIVGLVAIWCTHHLLEYVGTVVLWAWTNERIESEVRRRFWGWRNSALCAGFFIGGLFVWFLRDYMRDASVSMTHSYIVIAGLGAILLGLAVIPLMKIPALLLTTSENSSAISENCHTISTEQNTAVSSMESPHQSVWNTLRVRDFRWVLYYGVWMSLVGGFVQSAQYLFTIRYLNIPFELALMLDATMRIGQMFLSLSVGRWITRWGYRRILVPSTLLLAGCYVVFLYATPEYLTPYYLGWGMYLAWTGINVSIPARLVEFGDRNTRTDYVACYTGLTGLVLALATLVGGGLVDHLATRYTNELFVFQCFLIVGVLGRLIAVGIALRFPDTTTSQTYHAPSSEDTIASKRSNASRG